MSKLYLLLSLIVLLFPGQAVCDPHPTRSKQEELIVGNEKRDFLLHVPRSYRDGAAVPLLIVLHGGGGSAGDMQKLTRFNNLSAEAGFIVVYPEGEKNLWNDGRMADNLIRKGADDVQFIAQLVATLSSAYVIDQSRIYAVGFSNGGAMAFRLACQLPGLFAGIATVSASFPRYLANHCEPLTPLSVMMMHGTYDQTIPWEGGDSSTKSSQFGLFIPVEQTAKFWARSGGCAERPTRTRMKDLDMKAGYFVDELRFGSCKPNTEVLLYAIVGGGHGWPTQVTGPITDLLIGRALGKSLKELDASRLVWNFLSKQRRVPEK